MEVGNECHTLAGYLQKTATALIAEEVGAEWYEEDKISCPYMSSNPGLYSM
jgi:hypothetical protein